MFDFVGKRNYFFIISALILIAGIISYFVNGLQMDIQFEGGTLLQIEMNDGNFDVARAEEVFKEAVNKAASAQKLQTINAEDNKVIYMLQLRISSSETLTDDERNNVVDALRKEFNIKEDAAIEMQSVEPFIGAELKRNGIKAAVVASVLIVLYIWWRFRIMSGLSAAVSALIALIHDALVMFATYTLFQLPLNESFIAAILTILGYSINNTIVVYDRIRENRKLLKRATNTELVNISISQTLTRSINTAATTLICISTLYLFSFYYNIQSIKGFTFPILVGLVVGTYSSIFLAGPMWAAWRESRQRKVVAKKV